MTVSDILCCCWMIQYVAALDLIVEIKYKTRTVAAETARSGCKVLSIQYVYYFRAYQRQRTLHGVGVITKLYFAIFAAFKELMTLNLAHRSFKVNGGNRKPVYEFI